MSVVGPRPALPNEVATYNDYQRQRLLVKPGMTCYWQTRRNRDSITFDEWVDLDLWQKQASIELLERYAEIFDIRLSSLLRFSEEYGEASNQGAGQRFITKAMSKLIDSFSASHEA